MTPKEIFGGIRKYYYDNVKYVIATSRRSRREKHVKTFLLFSKDSSLLLRSYKRGVVGITSRRLKVTLTSYWSEILHKISISHGYRRNFALMRLSHCTSRDSSKQKWRAGFRGRLSATCLNILSAAPILRIEHSLWRGQLLSPKTTASTRDIPLGSVLNQTLRNHRESSLHRGPDDFVFSKKDGSALDPDVLRKDAPILDRLGIPRKKCASGFHTFRHSAASIVNEQTGNLKLAQKFLGHSTIKMTAGIYTHTSAEAERGAAISPERAIYGDLIPVVPNIENRNNFAALN
jgi:integrase